MKYLIPGLATQFDNWPNKGNIMMVLESNLKLIPEGMRDVLFNYVVYGIAPGHFLTAVLSNNLKEAVNRADAGNQPHLVDYIKFLYWSVPQECWGSEETVTAWLGKGAELRKGKGESG